MGFKTISLSALEGTVGGDNQCTVRPYLLCTREVAGLGSGTDPGAYGRKPTAWADFGTPVMPGQPEYFVGVNGYYILPNGQTVQPISWQGNYYGVNGIDPAWELAWGNGLGTPTDMAQDWDGVDLAAVVGNDVNVRLQVMFGDTHTQTDPAEINYILWGWWTDSLYPPPEENEGVYYYKTRSVDAVLSTPSPSITGDTFTTFSCSVNPKTTASRATVYLRWKKGANTSDLSTYDGQETLATSASGTGTLSFNPTVSSLEPETEYTFWLYCTRDTNGLTTTTGTPYTLRTEQLGSITFGTGTVQYGVLPTSANFSWTIPVSSVSRVVRKLPDTQLEVMSREDYEDHGWDAAYTRFSGVYPGADIVSDSRNRYFRSPDDPTRRDITGNGGVSGLTANREYVFRVRCDYQGGAVYPVSGEFTTPNYSTARPDLVRSLGML